MAVVSPAKPRHGGDIHGRRGARPVHRVQRPEDGGNRGAAAAARPNHGYCDASSRRITALGATSACAPATLGCVW